MRLSTMRSGPSDGTVARLTHVAEPLPRRPTPLSNQVSKQLSRMPVKNTGPEVRLRQAMHAIGLRFRVGAKLPGSPDVVFTRAKIAVFVDGCFWHACPEHGVLPKNNRAWWSDKLSRNVERDRQKDAELRALGWDVVRVWEHEDPVRAAEAIRMRWRARLARMPHGPVSVQCGNLVQGAVSGGSRGSEAIHG